MPAVPAHRVSVCLLTYNHVHVVAEAIESILKQDFTDFELVVSDDYSSDGTWDVVKSFEARDSRVRPVRPPQNLGMAANSNFAFSKATAPYVALLHHDDLCSPNLLRRWFEVLDSYPNVAFVSSSYESTDGSRWVQPLADSNKGHEVLENHLLSQWGCIFRGTAMIRRSCWDQVGGMRLQFGMLADVDLWMRLAHRYDVGYVADASITIRAVRPDYYPTDYWQWSWSRLKTLYEIHAANHREHYGQSSPLGRLRWAGFRARVSADMTWWLGYAIAKRKWSMLADAHQVANELELFPERVLRELLQPVGRALADYSAPPPAT